MNRKFLLLVALLTACTVGTEPATPNNPSSVVVSTTSTTSVPPTSMSTSTTAETVPELESSELAAEVGFSGSVSDVSRERLAHSWTDDCPVGVEDVVLVDVVHWGFDGEIHEGAIVVAREHGDAVLGIFGDLFELEYPIQSVIPIGELPPGIEDDDPDYNNTSGLHCRRATGSSRWSEHASGLAIDINPFLNPFITSSILWPANSESYLDRAPDEPGMIHADDEVVTAFEEAGWLWGGYWSSIKDYHHFSTTGR